ncbi:MAG: class I mannose-6-phosphate isomerase [Clostridia bacterium]|nr:class I mannose-6-phosphate isomerase [Clostridia bacterium]MDR3645811.1 class I mannose-6-phosphate isomerase [Clostridia bacterium]
MPDTALCPIRLLPACKDYIWGGTKLKTLYHKHSAFEKVAESWELSCHKDGLSTVANGEYAGLTLPRYLEEAGRGVLGTSCERFKQFPVLVKFIDAAGSLSVQVHPDDAYALAHEGESGKNEMWYIVDCDEGSKLIYGFSRAVTKEEFRLRIENNTLLEVLESVPVAKGDVFFIRADTIHAIGSGIVICEVQQSSNSTYRVYDFGRLGADGKPRALQIEKALDVTTRQPAPRVAARPPALLCEGYSVTTLVRSEYFITDLLDIQTRAELDSDERTFRSFTCVEGDFRLESRGGPLEIETGATVFVPAGAGKYAFTGRGKLLCVHY